MLGTPNQCKHFAPEAVDRPAATIVGVRTVG